MRDFPIPYYFLDNAHIRITLLHVDESASELVPNSDFSVMGAGSASGGSVHLNITPAINDQIIIDRIVPAMQETQYQQNDPFPAKATERAFDKLTMLAQQQNAEIANSIKFPIGDAANSVLPRAPGRAGRALIFDDDGGARVSDVQFPTPQALIDQTYVAGVDFNAGDTSIDLGSTDFAKSIKFVFMDAAYQQPGSYTYDGESSIVFDAPIPDGVTRITLFYIGMVYQVTPVSGTVTQPRSGKFFVQDGAEINRLNDRLFVGGATVNDGRFPNIEKDWLSQYQSSLGVGPSVVSGVAAVLTDENGASAQAFVAGSQTRHFTNDGASSIGIAAYALNNNDDHATVGWAYYGEAHKASAASGPVYCMELDTHTVFPSIKATPFQQGDVIGIQLGSGAGVSGADQHDSSAAIQIVRNPTKWQTGIVFAADSISGTDGITGLGEAISFAKGHCVQWHANGNVPTSLIYSSGTSTANAQALAFGEGLLALTQLQNGAPMCQFAVVPDAVNHLEIFPAVASAPPLISAAGADANIAINLAMKGTAVLGLSGTELATSANSGGASALPSTPAWFLPITVNGTRLKIPLYAN
ncbi:hypothetical protein C6T56_04415 [Burkholderia multivorans]|nr:hypothetical protein C6T56_04415 [Burkholderia multivorans]